MWLVEGADRVGDEMMGRFVDVDREWRRKGQRKRKKVGTTSA
jgi:hypothetical protein